MTQSSVVCSAVIHSAPYFLVKSILKYSESRRNNHNPITRSWRLLSCYLLAELSGTFSPLAGDSSSPPVSLSLSPCVHVVCLPLYLFHFSHLCEWALPPLSLRCLSSSRSPYWRGGRAAQICLATPKDPPGSKFFIHVYNLDNPNILIVHTAISPCWSILYTQHALRLGGEFFLIHFEGPRIAGVVHCSDFKASWGKFVIWDIGLFKLKLTLLDLSIYMCFVLIWT